MATQPNVRNFVGTVRADSFLYRQRRGAGLRVINKTGSTIAVNKVVAISGYDTTSKLPKIVLADADSAGLYQDIWVTKTSVSDGKQTNVYKGFMSTATLDTSGVTTVGDAVYLDTTAGGFTATAPTASNAVQQIVGYSQVKSSTVGQIAWDIAQASRGSDLSGTNSSETKVLAASAAFTSNATLASLTGFSWTLVAGGTYQFEVNLPATMTTNGGLSVALKYTTATLTSIQAQTYAATASDNTTGVSTQSTTTTDATKFFDSKTAAYTLVTLKGTLVVNAGGTVAVQVAQNTSHIDTTTVLLGAYAKFTKVL